MVTDKVSVQLHVCVWGGILGVCLVFCKDPLSVTTERGWAVLDLRPHPSELGLTLEGGRGPVEHLLAQDGAKAPLLSSGSLKSDRTL